MDVRRGKVFGLVLWIERHRDGDHARLVYKPCQRDLLGGDGTPPGKFLQGFVAMDEAALHRGIAGQQDAICLAVGQHAILHAGTIRQAVRDLVGEKLRF